jgi:hypothetical protein
MRVNAIGLAVMSNDPTAGAQWFVDHFGFEVRVDIGWYVNTQHDGHETFSLDFVRRDHESSAASR